MQEDCFFLTVCHNLLRYFIWRKIFDSLRPYFVRLTHGYPYICTDDICIFCSLHHIFRQSDGGTGCFCILLTLSYQFFIREILFRCTCHKIHAHLRAGNHVRISHIISCITHIDQFDAFESSEVFLNGQHIRQHLGRMIFVGQTVPYRNSCIFRQFFHDFLPKATIFNSFVHAAQDLCCIRDAFFFTDLGSLRIQIGGSHAQVMCRHFKRTAGSGTGLFENQCYIFPAQRVCQNSFFLFLLQICRQFQQICYFFRCIIF